MRRLRRCLPPAGQLSRRLHDLCRMRLRRHHASGAVGWPEKAIPTSAAYLVGAPTESAIRIYLSVAFNNSNRVVKRSTVAGRTEAKNSTRRSVSVCAGIA